MVAQPFPHPLICCRILTLIDNKQTATYIPIRTSVCYSKKTKNRSGARPATSAETRPEIPARPAPTAPPPACATKGAPARAPPAARARREPWFQVSARRDSTRWGARWRATRVLERGRPDLRGRGAELRGVAAGEIARQSRLALSGSPLLCCRRSSSFMPRDGSQIDYHYFFERSFLPTAGYSGTTALVLALAPVGIRSCYGRVKRAGDDRPICA